MNQIKLLPIKVPRQDTKFSLLDLIFKSLESNFTELKDGDILCISSKFVALSEGRYVKLSDVDVSSYATEIAEKYNIDPHLSELIVQESDKIFYGFDGFVLTFKDGILVPNAGIDTSNIMPGYAILYPEDSFKSAKILKSEIKKLFGTDNGIIITDSRLMPTRIGTTGVAIASSGVKPIEDERGKTDLFGNSIRVTQKAIADDLSSAAQLLMGECDESIPIVIIRDSNLIISDNDQSSQTFSVGFDECIFIKGLSNSKI